MSTGNGSGGPTQEEKDRIKEKVLEKFDQDQAAKKAAEEQKKKDD